ncbi:hypothetical protein ACSFA3_14410 [Variovorax sp. RHLX14]|uniref:hypothetical protein n=1 Tax=Variovorax sp. RHLX14 TaxID=1259731 RepID=UPI003F48BF04
MKIALCTLFEGHYHYGVAALVNSLVSAGYEGTVWVGHRGPLPAWIVDRPGFDSASARLQVSPRLELRAIELNPPVSLNYYKPTLMREILESHDPEADAVSYLDPDMVVKCNWSAMHSWLSKDGIALVEDADWDMPANHPKRARWCQFFAAHGENSVRAIDRYYNAGLVCIDRNRMDFLQIWERINKRVAAESRSGMRDRKSGGPESLFHSMDEDALNFALTLCVTPLNAAGPEAMDFVPGGNRLSHAVGAAKPWQGRHFRRALQGQPPSVASHWFYRFADGPLTPFSYAMLVRRRLSMTLAAVIGRVWSGVQAA